MKRKFRPRNSYSPKSCIFCGAKNLTKEHVFSRWTHKYMAPRQKGKAISFQATEYPSGFENTQFIKMSGQLRDWKILCVCGGTHLTCNGGWMKKMEDETKPLLEPLILGTEKRLTSSDQMKIAAWAILKSIVSEHDGHRKPVPTHYKQKEYLKKHGRPPDHGWAVWIGSFERRNWPVEWVSRPFLIVPANRASDQKDLRATYFNSNCSTQVIGKLFIQVIHAPMGSFVRGWRFRLPEKGALRRIWPNPGFSLKWPGRALTDRDADVAADAIPSFLSKLHAERISAAVPSYRTIT